MRAASPSISRRSGPRFGPLWILLGLLGSAPAAAGPGEAPAAGPDSDPAAALAAQLRAWQPLRAPVEPPRIQESDVRAALAGATVKGVVTVEGVAAGKAYGMRVFNVPSVTAASIWPFLPKPPATRCSTRWQSAAMRNPSRSMPKAVVTARIVATSRAADEATPAPRGTVP